MASPTLQQEPAGGHITHVEIRRVQNGFVVAGLDYSSQPYQYGTGNDMIQRVTYIAKDEDDLKNVISSILTGTEVGWLPTSDVPLINMRKIERDRTRVADMAKVAAMQQAGIGIGGPSVAACVGVTDTVARMGGVDGNVSIVGVPLNRP